MRNKSIVWFRHDRRQVPSSSVIISGGGVYWENAGLARCSPLLIVPGFLYTLWKVGIVIYFGQRSWLPLSASPLTFILVWPALTVSVSLRPIKNWRDLHLVRLQRNNNIFKCCVTIALILQKNSLKDKILLFYQPDICICCERILLSLRNMFKFLGHTQFLEVCTASKEIMLFHDFVFVLLRFSNGFN
jgi:hypothetical protein